MSRHTTQPRDDRGAVAVVVAVAMTVMLVAAGMVLDFGLARLDRQTSKAVADTAVSAGAQGMNSGDGRLLSYRGACEALRYLKANQPELASLSWSACSNPVLLDRECSVTDPLTQASYTGSANGISVEIRSPYTLAGSGWPEESLSTLQGDQLAAADGCRHLAVVIRRTRTPGLGSLATSSDLTTSVRSVGRVAFESDAKQVVALLLLERAGCGTITINGANSFVRVLANGATAGLIHSDSDATVCSGGSKVFVGDHANGIVARQSGATPGAVRNRAVGTANDSRSVDSPANVIAEGSAVSAGPLVTRKPVDDRYIAGARAAVLDYQLQAATLGVGYTVRSCGASAAQLASVTGKLWIQCGSSTSFNTPNVTLQASTVFFDAKAVSASNLSMPNATRVYISGDTSPNGNGLVANGSSFRMNHSGAATCPSTPTVNRARLVVGAGGITSNSSGTLQLCGTTVVLRGGLPGGCVPATLGLAPIDSVTCNGRLGLGGTTDWTAPNKIGVGATQADWDDLEDLAIWTEASGSHDVGGGGQMRLSGTFFLPNGEFKVHGGAAQDVLNSQYVARSFRADGGSVLEMAPNPNDSVGVPKFSAGLVR